MNRRRTQKGLETLPCRVRQWFKARWAWRSARAIAGGRSVRRLIRRPFKVKGVLDAIVALRQPAPQTRTPA